MGRWCPAAGVKGDHEQPGRRDQPVPALPPRWRPGRVRPVADPGGRPGPCTLPERRVGGPLSHGQRAVGRVEGGPSGPGRPARAGPHRRRRRGPPCGPRSRPRKGPPPVRPARDPPRRRFLTCPFPVSSQVLAVPGRCYAVRVISFLPATRGAPVKGASAAAEPLFRQVEDEAERLPDYAELYRRWEAQPWSPLALDFSRDAEQWRTATPELRRQWMGIGRFHGFHLGEAHLMRALAAFLEALPRPDQRRFVATQIADEARHDVFFDRFLEEALGLPPEETSDEAVLPRLSPGMRHLFLELLPARARRLAAEPHDRAALVEGVALVHLLIEGTLALSNMRVVLHDFRRLGLFPGFQAGFLQVVRDEARHILFGIRVLRDLAREEVLRERLVA